MRFKKRDRYEFQDTPRKRGALLRKQRQEREAMPLFSAAIEAEQPAADDVMRQRAERWRRHELEGRSMRAADWRRARARLASYPELIRTQLRAYWQACGWPGDPGYLISMLHMHDTGRLEATRQRDTPA